MGPVGRDPGKAQTVEFTVAGVVPEDWDGPSTFYIAMSDAQRHFVPIPVTAGVALEPGTSPDAVGAELRRQLPGLQVETAEERWEAARQAHREKLGTFTAILYILAGFGALG